MSLIPVNYSNTVPAAPGGYTNVVWQTDSSGNLSGYVPTASAPGVAAWAGLTGSLAPGQVIPFEGSYSVGVDAGISRINAASLAIGNGTFGDFTGNLKLTTMNAVTGYQVAGGATSGHVLRGNGTDFVDAQLGYGDLLGTPTLPANNAGTTHQFFTAYNSGTGVFSLARPSAADLSDTATSGNVLRGNGTDFVSAQLQYSDLGGVPTINTWNGLTGSLVGKVVPFESSPSLGIDTGLSRVGAGVLAVGNGTQGDTTGTCEAALFNAATGFQVAGAATSGNVLRGNATNFVSAQLGYSDLGGINAPVTQDKIAHILASVTPTLGQIIWATDVADFVVGDGTFWWYKSAYFLKASTTPNMGYVPFNDNSGRGSNYYSGASLAECNLGSNGSTANAGLRYDIPSDTVQVYLDGVWQTFAVGFKSRTDTVVPTRYTVDQQPSGMTVWINLTTGNSDEYLSLSGLPIVINNRACMGAFSAATNISGGTF